MRNVLSGVSGWGQPLLLEACCVCIQTERTRVMYGSVQGCSMLGLGLENQHATLAASNSGCVPVLLVAGAVPVLQSLSVVSSGTAVVYSSFDCTGDGWTSGVAAVAITSIAGVA